MYQELPAHFGSVTLSQTVKVIFTTRRARTRSDGLVRSVTTLHRLDNFDNPGV